MPGPLASSSLRRRLRHAAGRRSPLQRRVEASIEVSVPANPVGRVAGSVWGVAVVRDEEDVVVATCEHLLRQGLTGLVVVDHGSVDRTPELLADLAQQHPGVHVGRVTLEAFHQGRIQSYLAHLAHAAGADWVVPFDADEWWFAPGLPLASYLARQRADVVTAAMYAARPTAEPFVLGDTVQVDPSPGERRKVAFRAAPWVWVFDGNHEVDLPGERLNTLGLLHFSYRSLDQLTRRTRTGAAAIAAAGADLEPGVARHWHELAGEDDETVTRRWIAYLRGEDALPDPSGSRPGCPVRVAGYRDWPSLDPEHLLRRE